ncbi:sulfur carrier protein [Nitratiruptor sp. YY08-26]|nr:MULTISPECIES: sulfur carrier protein ThiS [unclassified Nitratiruptor]BCD62432.1 sulfur carrier protein [Nitratiruptor sp. YY08-13]BCD66368.1 sulfur carrier protein [Nitratiruptor sp. YY08-26]
MVTINGERKEIPNNSTIEDILKQLKIEEKVMAVAVNMEIVKKEEWSSFKPKEGDKIEFLGFTGGG